MKCNQYDELAEAHGWDKSRFGAYGVTPARTISRVLDALRKKGARPCGTEIVVLGSSVGWVAFGLSLLLPKASQTIGLEILGTRVYAANVAASILNGVRDICFVLGDVVEEAEAQCRDAALIWDSLGYGAENGGRTEGWLVRQKVVNRAACWSRTTFYLKIRAYPPGSSSTL